jgi:enamine deaminase RidA (YjgF/YER057c/UK114 family)
MDIQRSPVILAGRSAPYAKGTRVAGNNGYVWLSGCLGEDVNSGAVPEKAGAQAALAMNNIKTRLEEYGSSLSNIVHMWLHQKGQFPEGMANDPSHDEIRDAIEDFWRINCPEFLRGNNPPASTFLGVTALAQPAYLIEITVVAAIE